MFTKNGLGIEYPGLLLQDYSKSTTTGQSTLAKCQAGRPTRGRSHLRVVSGLRLGSRLWCFGFVVRGAGDLPGSTGTGSA